MSTANDRSEKSSYLLVRLLHGEGAATIERYTDLPYHWLGHISTPDMEADLPKNVGTLDADDLELVIPLDSFLSTLSDGKPHSPVYLEIEEVTEGQFAGDAGDSRRFWAGRLMQSEQNPDGVSDCVKLIFRGKKGRLKQAMGLGCSNHCAFIHFGAGCGEGIAEADFEVFAEIDAIDGKKITVSDTDITGELGRYWRRGCVEYDGLRIAIRDWSDADPTHLYLTRRPPDSWVGPLVRFLPGCDLTIETCRDVYDNEEFNGAIGYAMPAHNPHFQAP